MPGGGEPLKEREGKGDAHLPPTKDEALLGRGDATLLFDLFLDAAYLFGCALDL